MSLVLHGERWRNASKEQKIPGKLVRWSTACAEATENGNRPRIIEGALPTNIVMDMTGVARLQTPTASRVATKRIMGT